MLLVHQLLSEIRLVLHVVIRLLVTLIDYGIALEEVPL